MSAWLELLGRPYHQVSRFQAIAPSSSLVPAMSATQMAFPTNAMPVGLKNPVATDTGEVRYRCTIHQRMRGTLTVLLKP